MLTFLLIAAAAATMPVADSVIAKGLENLRNIHAAAQILDFRAAMGTTPDFDPAFADPWGTPYRIDIEKGRIVSAGSDRVFDENSWNAYEQFEGTDGDVVF